MPLGCRVFCCLPRRLDRHHAVSVSGTTLARYHKYLQAFVAYLDEQGLNPDLSESLDAALVCYKNHASLKKADLEGTIASLEFHIPQVKGSFVWSKRVISGIVKETPIKHTLPLSHKHAKWLACHMAAKALFRMGVAVVVQTRTGMRPSEVLALREHHILLPTSEKPRFVFRLGAMRSTKVQREQVTFLEWSRDESVARLLWRVVVATKPEERLFPYTYEQYRTVLAMVCQENDVVCHLGRWASESSFNTYVDVVSASQVEAAFSLRKQDQAVQFCSTHLESYFPALCFSSKDDGIASAYRGGRRAFPERVAANPTAGPDNEMPRQNHGWPFGDQEG